MLPHWLVNLLFFPWLLFSEAVDYYQHLFERFSPVRVSFASLAIALALIGLTLAFRHKHRESLFEKHLHKAFFGLIYVLLLGVLLNITVRLSNGGKMPTFEGLPSLTYPSHVVYAPGKNLRLLFLADFICPCNMRSAEFLFHACASPGDYMIAMAIVFSWWLGIYTAMWRTHVLFRYYRKEYRHHRTPAYES